MSSVPQTNTTNQTTNSTTTTKTSSKSNALGQTEFLNLLMTQLKYQDPMNPMDDTSFIAEMANFSALEQMSSLNKTLSGNQDFERFTAASVMIGRTVEIEEPNGTTKPDGTTETSKVKGVVQEVKKNSDGVQVKVNDKLYDLDHVVDIKQD